MNTICRRTANFLLLTVLLGLLAPRPAEAIRFMTYNLLNYSSGRSTEFQNVLAATQPDVIVVQEILSQSAVNVFLSSVLDVIEPGEWAAAPFVNGTDTDNAMFYRTSAVTFVSHFIIGTALRDIDEVAKKLVESGVAKKNVASIVDAVAPYAESLGRGRVH